MQTIITSRVLIFDTEEEGDAYLSPIGFQDVCVIKGDNTRFKRGDGKPSVTGGFQGSTFAELPWFTSGGGGALTDGNGTTANGTAVDLGGTLNKDAVITSPSFAYEVTVDNDTDYADLTMVANLISMLVGPSNGDTGSGYILTPTGFQIYFKDLSENSTQIALNGTGLTVTDAINQKGFTEAADYSANKTDFSYATKKMVSDMIAAALVAHNIT